MAHRGLLTDDERQLVLGVPRQEHLIIKHYTLSQDDLDMVLRKRGARNHLVFAVQRCLALSQFLAIDTEMPERTVDTYAASRSSCSASERPKL